MQYNGQWNNNINTQEELQTYKKLFLTLHILFDEMVLFDAKVESFFLLKYANITYLYLTCFNHKSLKGIIQKVFSKDEINFRWKITIYNFKQTQIFLFTHQPMRKWIEKKIDFKYFGCFRAFVVFDDVTKFSPIDPLFFFTKRRWYL